MRGITLVFSLGIFAASATALGAAAAPAPPAATHSYRMGKAPKAEIVAAGKHVKIDPEAKSTKAIRSLPPERFDPITRYDRVDHFYHDTLKDRLEEARRDHKWHCGPFRPEFIYWVWSWRAEWRARWAWHHRMYLDELLWNEWMLDQAFAAEIAILQRDNPAADPDYMPPELASTSPLVIYTDEYINAVYNPAPFLAVLKLNNLKSDANSDWIASATSDSLLSNLSSFPGLFVADQQQVTRVLQKDKDLADNTVEPLQAARIGKAIDVERVVAGSYVVDGDKVLLNLRIVNVQSGAVEDGISKTIPRDHFLDEMPGLAASLAKAMGYAPAGESATITTLAPVSAPPAVAVQPENGSRVVNLLGLVDVQRDAVKGTWTLANGALVSDKGGHSRIQFAYQPPDEYDFRIVFTRTEGTDSVNQICASQGRQFSWLMSAWRGTVCGFSMIHDEGPDRNPSSSKSTKWLKNGQEYTSIVKVRKTGVEAYLDGKLISAWKTEFSDMSLFRDWALRRHDVLAVGTSQSPTVFRTIEVIEITGTGKTLTAAGAAPSVAADPAAHTAPVPPVPTPAPTPASWIIPGKWSRRWTIRGADLSPDLRTQTYQVFDGGARVKAFSWNLPLVPEADGSLSIEGSHFFQTFAKGPNGISVRQWKNRSEYTAGEEPMYIGVFEPIDEK